MSIYEYVDPTGDEMERLFWSLVPLIAEQADVTEADAFMHIKRNWTDRIKALKGYSGIDYKDDGRAAAWRVRLMIWRVGHEGQEDLFADSDAGARFDQHDVAPGQTIIYGLPNVAAWVRELADMAHPGAVLDGMSEHTLANKIKSLRVALSNSGGRSTWRIRYSVTAPAAAEIETLTNVLKAGRERGPASSRFMANVYVQREESPRGK